MGLRLTRVWLFLLLPTALQAQSSQFGVRGLGYPGREMATRAAASGGAFALFDPESSVNPAALGGIPVLTSIFTIQQNFMTQDNPAGSASTRDTRFPQLMVVGPVRQTGVALGFSYSNYTSRDFSIASQSTIDLRGIPVGITDSFSSRGGLSDLRLAGSYRIHDRWMLGGAFHILTGSNRLRSRRLFADSSYLASLQQSEVSYAGIGLSLGIIRQFGPQFAMAAMVRSDGHLNVDRDSTRVGRVDLPYSFGFGLRWQATSKLDLAAHSMYRTWSAANSDLLAQGGTGSDNTLELAVGANYTRNLKRPFRWPFRVGARYAQLPFPLLPGNRPHEVGVSAGTGMRFAQDRGGMDFTVEHVWRSEAPYKERGFVAELGISVRP
jgi:hypothetical protein